MGEPGEQEQSASTPAAEPAASAGHPAGHGPQGPGEGVAVVGGRQAPARRRRVARRGADAPAAASSAGGQADGHAGVAPSGAPADGAEDTAPADGAPGDQPVATRPRTTAGGLVVRRAVAIPAAVVLVVAVAAAAFFGVSWSSANGQLQQRDAVQGAARAFVIDLSNLSTKDVNGWYHSLIGASTGAFAKQAKSFFGGGVLSELKAARAAEQGTIWALQVTAVHGDKASASAVVYESYDNTALASAGKGVQHDTVWLNLTLAHTSSGWKVSDVTARNGATGGLLTPNTATTPATPGGSSSGG